MLSPLPFKKKTYTMGGAGSVGLLNHASFQMLGVACKFSAIAMQKTNRTILYLGIW